MKNLTIKHSGHMGDIIYSLPAIKRLSEVYGRKVEVLVFVDRTWEFFSAEDRPKTGLIDEDGLSLIKDVLSSTSYISDVRKWKGEFVNYDFDMVKHRGQEIGMPHSNISRWYMYLFPEASTDLSKPTLDLLDVDAEYYHRHERVCTIPDHDYILVNRTSRWLNPYINYVFLHKYEHVYFVGSKSEYEHFMLNVPSAKYIEVDNGLHLASLIGHSKVFIGNQSLCYAVAEQLKTTRILEACSNATNVLPIGKNGYDFYTQQGLEYLVDFLYKKEDK